MNYRVITFLAIMILLLNACVPSTNQKIEVSPSPETVITPTNTITPTSVPTSTLTATPVPNPVDFLLSTEETKDNFEGPFQMIEGIANGNHFYEISYWLAGTENSINLDQTITIAPQPWVEIPENIIEGGSPVEAPKVGEISKAYSISDDRYNLAIVFVKDRALVTIKTGNLGLDTAVKYAQMSEAKLPSSIPDPQPITFPTKVDNSLAEKYFTKLSIPDSVKLSTGHIALEVEAVNELYDYKMPTFAIFDTQTSTYVYKRVGYFYFTTNGSYYYPLTYTGNFEFRIAINDVMIKSIPFTVN